MDSIGHAVVKPALAFRNFSDCLDQVLRSLRRGKASPRPCLEGPNRKLFIWIIDKKEGACLREQMTELPERIKFTRRISSKNNQDQRLTLITAYKIQNAVKFRDAAKRPRSGKVCAQSLTKQ